MTCTIIGDSIAAGLSYKMAECVAVVQPGVASDVVLTLAGASIIAGDLIVSAGQNDTDPALLEARLEGIRAKAPGRVVWLLPPKPMAGDVVNRVAARHGDSVLVFAPGLDGIHPGSYGVVAEHVRELLK